MNVAVDCVFGNDVIRPFVVLATKLAMDGRCRWCRGDGCRDGGCGSGRERCGRRCRRCRDKATRKHVCRLLVSRLERIDGVTQNGGSVDARHVIVNVPGGAARQRWHGGTHCELDDDVLDASLHSQTVGSCKKSAAWASDRVVASHPVCHTLTSLEHRVQEPRVTFALLGVGECEVLVTGHGDTLDVSDHGSRCLSRRWRCGGRRSRCRGECCGERGRGRRRDGRCRGCR